MPSTHSPLPTAAPVISITPGWRFRVQPVPLPHSCFLLRLSSLLCNIQHDASRRMRGTHTVMQMSLRNQVWAGRYNELAGRKGNLRDQFPKESGAKLCSHAHKKEGAAIPLITSAVIFEKIPTDRNTAAEKMTSSAHYCSPSPFSSVQIHTLIAIDRCLTRHQLTKCESTENILNIKGAYLLTASIKQS